MKGKRKSGIRYPRSNVVLFVPRQDVHIGDVLHGTRPTPAISVTEYEYAARKP